MAARRVSLPSADDLFRPTTDPDRPAREGREPAVRAVPDRAPEQRSSSNSSPRASAPTSARTTAQPAPRPKRPSGRVRHDEKMTVYVTSDELLEIEHARLSLRRDHGLAVDRGRLVREALHLVLEELDAHGGESALVRRLCED